MASYVLQGNAVRITNLSPHEAVEVARHMHEKGDGGYISAFLTNNAAEQVDIAYKATSPRGSAQPNDCFTGFISEEQVENLKACGLISDAAFSPLVEGLDEDNNPAYFIGNTTEGNYYKATPADVPPKGDYVEITNAQYWFDENGDLTRTKYFKEDLEGNATHDRQVDLMGYIQATNMKLDILIGIMRELVGKKEEEE